MPEIPFVLNYTGDEINARLSNENQTFTGVTNAATMNLSGALSFTSNVAANRNISNVNQASIDSIASKSMTITPAVDDGMKLQHSGTDVMTLTIGNDNKGYLWASGSVLIGDGTTNTVYAADGVQVGSNKLTFPSTTGTFALTSDVDKITAITKTSTSGNVDTYTIYTEQSPSGIGTFTVTNGASNFVEVGAGQQWQGIDEFCEYVESVGGSMGPAASAKCIFYAYDSFHRETFIAFGGFISGSTCTIIGYDVTSGHPFRAHRPLGSSYSHIYTDVDFYAYIDKTNYTSLDSMCNAAFAYLENAHENMPENRWKRYIAHRGSQITPTEVYTFVSYAGNTDPDFPIVKKLYGYQQKGGFFCVIYDNDNDVWNWHHNSPVRYGPYATTADVLADLNALSTSGVPFNILSAYTSFKETTSDGGTSHTVTRTRSLLVNYKYSEEVTDPSSVTFYYIIGSSIHTWQEGNDGNLFLMIDSEETYNPA